MEFALVCIGMIVVLGIVAAVANLFDKEDDTIKKGHDCSTCTEADEGNCKIHELMEHCKKAKKLTIIISALLMLVVEFFAFNMDYSRTEKVQFEDDEYYYYVKAVPKVTVATPERKVKKINRAREQH